MLNNNYELSKETILNGCEKCLINAQALKKDGTILFKKRRYNSAVVLLTVACEEIGKCNLLIKEFYKYINDKENDWDSFFNKKYKKHTLRLEEFLDLFYKNGVLGAKLAEKGFHKDKQAKSLQNLKNTSLYTDFDRESNSFYISTEEDWKGSKRSIKILITLLNRLLRKYLSDLKELKFSYLIN